MTGMQGLRYVVCLFILCSLWLLSAAALFAASITYAADEARVVAAERQAGAGFRQLSDEGAHDRMPLLLKQHRCFTMEHRALLSTSRRKTSQTCDFGC